MLSEADKAAIVQWARGQRLAEQRIAREANAREASFDLELERVDELRELADALGAKTDPELAHAENLAFHLTWAKLRRVLGFG